MGAEEVESYRVGETDDFLVCCTVRDRAEPEAASWTVEVTTRTAPGEGGALATATLGMPAESARELAPLLAEAPELLSRLIEGSRD
jgi:hypothetical protein